MLILCLDERVKDSACTQWGRAAASAGGWNCRICLLLKEQVLFSKLFHLIRKGVGLVDGIGVLKGK